MVKNGVLTAFEILLEEIESVIDGLKKEGTDAFQEDEYDKAEEMLQKAKSIEIFKGKVKQLQDEWKKKFLSVPVRSTLKKKAKDRLRRGLKTPQDAFRIPILEALVELRGSARMPEVLKLVENKMKDKLNKYDYQELPSGRSIRWRNTAQWCRNTMVQEGLLKKDSPRGVWEITEKGIKYLKEKVSVDLKKQPIPR